MTEESNKIPNEDIDPNETAEPSDTAEGEEPAMDGAAQQKNQKLKLTLRKTEGGRVVDAKKDEGDGLESTTEVPSRRNLAAAQTTILPGIDSLRSDESDENPAVPKTKDEVSAAVEDPLSKGKKPLKLGSEEAPQPQPESTVPQKEAPADSGSEDDKPITAQSSPPETSRPEGRPRLQVRSKTVPPGAENAPSREEVKKRQKKKDAQKKASALQYCCAFVALLLVFAGNALTAMPAWKRAIQAGIVPTQELVVLGIVALVMGLLLFSRRLPLRILAGLLIFLMICGGLFVTFYGYVPSSWGVRMSTETLSQFAGPTLMLSAVMLFLGGFVLNTGGRGWQWIVSMVFVGIAAIFPFLPESALGSIGFGGTLAVPGIDPAKSFKRGWTRVTMTTSMGIWRSEKGDAECMVQKWAGKEFDSLDDFVETRRHELEQKGFGSPAMFPVFGRDHQIQATMFGNSRRVEFLAVRGKENYYAIEFKMDRGAYPDYRGFIKEVFVGVP